MKKVTVVIPCYNEEAGIAAVIDGFPRDELRHQGYELDVLVVDNNSTDRTASVARKAGARVIKELKQGKGHAIRTGFYSIRADTDFVVMLDGDDTYKPQEILRLLEPLDSGFSDVIIGSRLGGKIKQGSMRGFNRFGNKFFSFLVRLHYRVNTTDVLTGYFAWRYEAIVKLRPFLQSEGFAIEMEMITRMARLGYAIYSVPISYEQRSGESSLSPVRDGVRIFKTFLKQLWWKPRVKRIAFVSDTVYPFNKGGKETRLHEVSMRLVKEGTEVHIYTMKWWGGSRHIIRNGVHLHAIGKLHRLYKGEKRSITEAVWFSLACLRLLFTKFDVIDVDHMPFFPLFTVKLVCVLRGKKMYATWHEVWGKEYWSTYLGGLSGKVAALVENLSFKLPSVIVSSSKHTTDRLRASKVRCEIVTVPLGVDVERIFTVTPHKDKSDVIYAGRLIDHKNVDVLIRAIAIVKRSKPKSKCLIIGDGPEKELLKKLAADPKLGVGDNIIFHDFFEEHNDLYARIKSSKVSVLPSVREGFGLSVIEANACGIPAITTSHQHNAARDLIYEGENGYLVELDKADIANKILKVLNKGKLLPLQTLDGHLRKYRWSTVTKNVERAFAINTKPND